MPCYITGTAEGDANLAASDAVARALNLARMLCRVCEHADSLGYPLPPEVIPWWDGHKKIDADRRKREKAEKEQLELAKKARAKLTPAELKALGL